MGSYLTFICGFPGGGTDLTKTILNAHPDIHLIGEMPLLYKIAEAGYHKNTIFTTLKEINSFKETLRLLDIWENIEHLSVDFSEEIEKQGFVSLSEALRRFFTNSEVKIWGNKTPQNTENISKLENLFPEARYLIVTRDVRDVCLSWKDKWGKSMLWCAEKWAHRMAVGWQDSQKMDPEKILFIKFEDLLLDLDEVCREICWFLGVPFSARMLEHQKYTPKALDGKRNYGEPIKSDNTQKWREGISSKFTKRIEEIAYPTMKLLEYEIVYADKHVPISKQEKLFGIINDFWAMILVGNRASSKNTIFRRLRMVFIMFRKKVLE